MHTQKLYSPAFQTPVPHVYGCISIQDTWGRKSYLADLRADYEGALISGVEDVLRQIVENSLVPIAFVRNREVSAILGS